MLAPTVPRTTVAWRRPLFIMAMSALGACGDTTAARVASWSIVSGTGSLSSATSTTDTSGQASVEFTAGAVTGDVVVDAIVSGLDAVPFAITVTSSTDGG